MMFNREIIIRLSLLFPRSNQQNKEQSNDKNEQVCSFKCDDPGWVRNYSRDIKWSPGKVVEKCGPRVLMAKLTANVTLINYDTDT